MYHSQQKLQYYLDLAFFDQKQPSMAIAEKKNDLLIQFQWQISTCSDWPNHILKGTYGFVLMSRIYRLVLSIFFRYQLFEKSHEPSRAFWSKARAKTEPSLGSGATLIFSPFSKSSDIQKYFVYLFKLEKLSQCMLEFEFRCSKIVP